jgi:hypothetical protein
MKKLFYLILVLLLSELVIFSQKVDPSTARKVAIANFHKYNLTGTAEISEIVTLGLNNDTLIYIFKFAKEGFVIVSGNYAAPPVLGQCYTDVFDTIMMPPGLLFLLDKYKYEMSKINEIKLKPIKDIKNKWNEILSGNINSSKSYSVGTYMVQTTWGQEYGYDYYATEEHPIGCTGVAMAQILHYWNCRIPGNYMWINMHLDDADLDNALLIYDACVACKTNENHSSTPGKARDGFVDYFGISSSADVKWRIWHLSNWKEMLEDEIDLERPLLYSAGSIIPPEGHSWVIDGYNEDDQFHCNWGWYGSFNGFYS